MNVAGSPEIDAARTGSQAHGRVRLQDVAHAAGVSLSQASAAISGRAGVNAGTRSRVLDVAHKLGYRPNDHALALARATRSRFISIVLLGVAPTDDEPPHYLGAMLNGILLRTAATGLDVRISPIGGTDLTIAEQLRALPARDVADGYLIVTFVDIDAADIAPLQEGSDPFVLINRNVPGADTLVSTADFAGAGMLAVDHLVEFGHASLGIICPPHKSLVIKEYLDGWGEALGRQELMPNGQIFRVQNHDTSAIAALADELAAGLKTRKAPTGLVCLNEKTAHQLLHALADRGVAVPDDLSLVTVDNAVAPYTTPALTSIDLNLHLVGASAVDLIANRLMNLEAPRTAVARLPVELVVRASSGPARS